MGKQTPPGLLAILFLILGISGCATSPTAKQAQPWTAERYYQAAREAQTNKNFQRALEHLSELSTRYPDSAYAQLAPLEIAYALYSTEKYESAIRAAKQFTERYPQHSSNDYAHYLAGLSYTKLATGNANNEMQYIRLAFGQFSKIALSYPQSKYHAEALKRIDDLRDRLAQHELDAIKQLLDNRDTTAALKRAGYLSKNYPNSPATAQVFELISAANPITINAKKDDSLRGERWLLKQDPQHFTIQIAGTSNKSQLEAFVKENGIKDKTAYYRRNDMDKEWYSILYGSYRDHNSASEAAQQLKSSLPIKAPWVRRFGDIQQAIRNHQQQNNGQEP